MTGKELSHRPPKPHYAKGDLTAANARLAELYKLEAAPVGRPRKPAHLLRDKRFSTAFSKAEYLLINEYCVLEGISMAKFMRRAVAQYLRSRNDHK